MKVSCLLLAVGVTAGTIYAVNAPKGELSFNCLKDKIKNASSTLSLTSQKWKLWSELTQFPKTTGKPITTQSTSMASTNASISSTSSTDSTPVLLSTTPVSSTTPKTTTSTTTSTTRKTTTVTVSSLIDREGNFFAYMKEFVSYYVLYRTPSCLVILITGGFRSGLLDSTSVELFDPVTKESCELPHLPSDRTHHTQDGPLLCGGSWPDQNQDVGLPKFLQKI